jgi:hypothetical protein
LGLADRLAPPWRQLVDVEAEVVKSGEQGTPELRRDAQVVTAAEVPRQKPQEPCFLFCGERLDDLGCFWRSSIHEVSVAGDNVVVLNQQHTESDDGSGAAPCSIRSVFFVLGHPVGDKVVGTT